jgi:hypothetical protein
MAEPTPSAGLPPAEYVYSPPSCREPIRVAVAAAHHQEVGGDACESLGGDAHRWDSTGTLPWPAMPLLCYWVLSPQGAALLAGSRVLELGAGVGVPGLLAGRFCSRLVLTGSSLHPARER